MARAVAIVRTVSSVKQLSRRRSGKSTDLCGRCSYGEPTTSPAIAPIILASLTSRIKEPLWRSSGLLIQKYSERVPLHRAHVTIPALISGIPDIAHGSCAKLDCQRLG